MTQNIDFRTSHNIVIRFQSAGLIDRIGAFVLDFCIVIIISSLLLSIISNILFLATLVSILIFFCYHLGFEIFNLGQTPGKKVLKIRVVTLDGDVPSLNQYLIRWAFRLLDIGSTLGMLAIIGIYSSEKGQRIGDLMAGTTVIKNNKTHHFNFFKNLQANTRDYVPQFPGVTRYNDDEMLLLKTVLQRYKMRKTPENENNVLQIGNKIANDLKFRIPDHGYLSFLERVLEDYIILTRK